MPAYIGIDLGTTNTAVVTFDGRNTNVVKAYAGADSTPSAVFVRPDSSILCGQQAVTAARVGSFADLAVGFKRLLGSHATFTFPTAGLTKDPVWASSELLKYVFSSVPQELAFDPDRRIVVTVPAAFGHEKNAATKRAADLAGLGRIELLPEPVAAAVAVFHKDPTDRTLLFFDIGGGTFDVSIVRMSRGQFDIIAHGGIEHHGGRDWDVTAKKREVYPWLVGHGVEMSRNDEERYEFLLGIAVEEAKVEMSRQIAMNPTFTSTTTVTLFSHERGPQPSSGEALDIKVPIDRSTWDEIVADSIETTVRECLDLLAEKKLTPADIDGVVFIGGPTMWPPLRKFVTQKLGIAEYGGQVNPLTVVAEGAAIHAQTVTLDGSGESELDRIKTRQFVNFPLVLAYPEFVADSKCVVKVTLDVAALPSAEFDIRGPGYDSTKIPISLTKDVVVELLGNGASTFTVTVYPLDGSAPVSRDIEINKVVGVGNIPSNRRMFVRALSRDGERYEAIELCNREGLLPLDGSFTVRSVKQLNPETDDSIQFKVFEGEIRDPITDNRFVGAIHLNSSQLGGKILRKGAELVCKFHMDRGLSTFVDVQIPDLEMTVKGLFLGGVEVSDPMLSLFEIREFAQKLHQRILDFLKDNPVEREVADLLPKLAGAITTLKESKVDSEVQTAIGNVQEATKGFWRARFANLPDALNALLAQRLQFFETAYQGRVFPKLTDAEKKRLEELREKGTVAANAGDQPAFDAVDNELDSLKWRALWRCDWWVKEWLERYSHSSRPEDVQARAKEGLAALEADDFSKAKAAMNDCITLTRAAEQGAQDSTTAELLDDIQST